MEASASAFRASAVASPGTEISAKLRGHSLNGVRKVRTVSERGLHAASAGGARLASPARLSAKRVRCRAAPDGTR